MVHAGKQPFAPWGERDHPEAESDEDARWKWVLPENYVDGDTVAMAEDDPRLDGRAFLQQHDDPFMYVDGDDVRDPETGAVHSEFVAVLERLGLTYADVSQSEAGLHANYRGALPDGVKRATWQLDAEPWGPNDDVPSIEIYAGKRVFVMTSDHVPGTPTEVREVDHETLRAVLDDNDRLPEKPNASDRKAVDLTHHEPMATGAEESTDEIRDIYHALDRVDARDVAERTIVRRWNDDASTSDGKRAFWPTWGSSTDNGTANVVDEDIWQDTGDRGGYGGPVVMACIDADELSDRGVSPRDASGATWWRGVEHLRDLGFEIPEYAHAASATAHHTAVLPPAVRDLSIAASGWHWRHAATSVDRDLTVADARERTVDAIGDAYTSYDQVPIEALPTMGKSYEAIKAAAATDAQVTFLTGRGHKEL
ncbi:MAG: hypothetical protein V5A43_08045 [Haloarculaceae archaeon]